MPQTTAQLESLLHESSRLGGFDPPVRLTGDPPTWSLAADALGDVTVEWNDASDRLLLSTEVGAVPSERYESALSEALSFGLIWRQTGGARMALTPDRGALEILVDLHAHDLAGEQVANLARNLLVLAEEWRQSFADPIEESAEADEALPPPGFVQV